MGSTIENKSVWSRWKKRFTLRRLLLASIGLIFFVISWSNFRVHYVSKDHIYSKVNQVPEENVGLILGTTKNLNSGNENLYFSNRISAAVALYKAGKVKHFLISGDNGTKEYNEPEDMKQSLIAKGVPENAITLDYAGFDTYDSMIRAKEIFGQKSFTVISQRFHVKRAVYIARSFGINAKGYCAKDVRASASFRGRIRETFARVKAWGEVLLGVKPTFLGKKEPIVMTDES